MPTDLQVLLTHELGKLVEPVFPEGDDFWSKALDPQALSHALAEVKRLATSPGARARLIYRWLTVHHPLLEALLVLLDLMPDTMAEGITPTLNTMNLKALFSDPASYLSSVYEGDNGRDKLLSATAYLANSIGAYASYDDVDAEPSFGAPTGCTGKVLSVAFAVGDLPGFVGLLIGQRGDELIIAPFGTLTWREAFGGLTIELWAKIDGEVTLTSQSAAAAGDAELGVRVVIAEQTFDLGGSDDVSDAADERRWTDESLLPPLEIAEHAVTPTETAPAHSTLSVGAVTMEGSILITRGVVDPTLSLTLDETTLSVMPTDADYFLSALLPQDGLHATLRAGIAWSRSEGLTFSGGLGLSWTVSLDRQLGPILLQQLNVALVVDERGVKVAAGLDASTKLGPMAISVSSVGFFVGADWSGELSYGFKPPTGLGLTIDAAGVTGGGFIQFDEERGQYAGLLALQLADLCDITAIALLDTKLPDGAAGWSFLGLLFAEFSPGLQVGAGFTLLGVGGLFGFNKEIDTDALLAMYAARRVGALMFPEDPVAAAPQLIADLRGVFPTAPGRVVFGPFVKMGFGTPTVVEAELGVLISLPDPVVIVLLGELSIYLPARDAPIAELHVDVLGLLDLGKKMFFLDGRLRDSRVLFFKLSGGMAFWLSWGQGTDFAFSIGGFHPAFTPPPDLLVPPRLTCSMGFGDYARLEMRQYLAITPNTFQIGSHVELNAGLCGFGVRAWAGYDALLYFKPLRFQVDFTAGVEVRCGGRTLASLDIDGHMTGPNPFHLWGKIRISLLFFDIKIPINLSFGASQREELPTRTPLDALVASLGDEANWSTEGSAGGVVLDLAREQDEAPILDPSGAVRFLQREVPLERPIERFEQAELDVPVTLSVTLGGVRSQLIDEPMPPASWRKLTDAQRLSLPRPFEPTPAGLRFTTDAAAYGSPVTLTLTWDESVTDEPNQPQPPPKGRALKVAPLGVRLPADWLVQETP